MGVPKMPGAMAQTRMRWLARSRAMGSVIPAIAAFEAA